MSRAPIVKIFISLLLSAVLLGIGFYFFIGEEEKNLLLSIKPSVHLTSLALVLPLYLLIGIEWFLIYKQTNNAKIDLYDILTLPYVVNLWGHLIPFQGSFIYFLSY